MALSTDAVNKQLDNMVSFILKEGQEKAEEIKHQGEMDFTVEKMRLVNDARVKIRTEYEKKAKKAEVDKKIAHSGRIASSRRELLQARDEAVNQINSDARERLAAVAQGSTYKPLLKELLVQSFVVLNELEVRVQAREEDKAIVQSLLPEATKAYKDLTGKDLKATLNTERFLPPAPKPGHEGASCCGGVVVTDASGKISCANTLDSRLAIAYQQRLPDIRKMVFGPSKTRVHLQ